MGALRMCSRSACREAAMATLTYVYADSTAVLGPLAVYPEPHSYDLCVQHAQRLTVPRGWEVLRIALPGTADTERRLVRPEGDELSALADAVREERPDAPESIDDAVIPQRLRPPLLEPPAGAEGTRRGHLRALREP
ncbi:MULTISPECIES: DUF3499 domain-containing protein [Arthrobacter]|uniref:DUF3499 domain-containing protein n=2 Tax=Arthrobacter TaxID=1663 RepID=A0ABU9KKD2_9MICC|nr:DUF3499 domain-containing protein [Arthrobacter sp. YJM1]MDP5227359.1 DUF3499 domain-containing protein [Arthrobacter sp. YJM1]